MAPSAGIGNRDEHVVVAFGLRMNLESDLPIVVDRARAAGGQGVTQSRRSRCSAACALAASRLEPALDLAEGKRVSLRQAAPCAMTPTGRAGTLAARRSTRCEISMR